MFAKRAPLPPPGNPKFPTRLGLCQKNRTMGTKTDPKPDKNRSKCKVEVVLKNFDSCGQLDAYGPEENLDQT